MKKRDRIVLSVTFVAIAIGVACKVLTSGISPGVTDASSRMVIEPWVEAMPLTRDRHAQLHQH